MSYQQVIVAVMLALGFLFRTVSAANNADLKGGAMVVALVLLMFWFGALVMLLHSGGFW